MTPPSNRVMAIEGVEFASAYLPFLKWIRRRTRSRKIRDLFTEDGFPMQTNEVIRVFELRGEQYAVKERSDLPLQRNLLLILKLPWRLHGS